MGMSVEFKFLLTGLLVLATPLAFALQGPAAEAEPAAAAVEMHAAKADTDGDGKVSFEEYKAARLKNIEQQFNNLDVNHDGYIDDMERSLALQKLKAQIRQLREQQKARQ